MFFGQFSWASQAMTSLIRLLDRNKHAFKAREQTDPHFCSKFMYAIDTRYQIWLRECMQLTQHNRINDSLLDFKSIIEQVRFGTFELRLPSAFSKPTTMPQKEEDKSTAPKQKGIGKAKDNSNNRKKKQEKEVNKQIINKNPVEAFKLKEGETWAGTFANKNISNCVPWSGNECKMCPHWFIHGHCFKNCFHANSHVSASKVPSTKVLAFVAFMQEIRDAANRHLRLGLSSARPPKKLPDDDRPQRKPPDIMNTTHPSTQSTTSSTAPPYRMHSGPNPSCLPSQMQQSTQMPPRTPPTEHQHPDIGVAECI
jgi:hypothetical protein